MKTAILLPVLRRPHRVEPLLESIAGATPEPHSVIFAASDQPTVDELDRLGQTYIRDDDGSYPRRINALFNITIEPYVFLGADDLHFHPGWLTAALDVMATVDGVVSVNDLHNPAGVHFLVSRNYANTLGAIDQPGAILHEGYRHTYCDDELRHTAISRGRYGRAEDAVVEHLHCGNGKAPHDDVYQIGADSMVPDLAVFMGRRHLWEE